MAKNKKVKYIKKSKSEKVETTTRLTSSQQRKKNLKDGTTDDETNNLKSNAKLKKCRVKLARYDLLSAKSQKEQQTERNNKVEAAIPVRSSSPVTTKRKMISFQNLLLTDDSTKIRRNIVQTEKINNNLNLRHRHIVANELGINYDSAGTVLSKAQNFHNKNLKIVIPKNIFKCSNVSTINNENTVKKVLKYQSTKNTVQASSKEKHTKRIPISELAKQSTDIKSNENLHKNEINNNKNYNLNNKQKSLTKRGKHMEKSKNDIFDFGSSQSSLSDRNEPDPLKDILKKLADEGKVKMVKYKKGTGKLQTKFPNGKKTNKEPAKKDKAAFVKKQSKLLGQAVEIEKNNQTDFSIKEKLNEKIICDSHDIYENSPISSMPTGKNDSNEDFIFQINNSTIKLCKENSSKLTSLPFIKNKKIANKKELLSYAKSFVTKIKTGAQHREASKPTFEFTNNIKLSSNENRNNQQKSQKQPVDRSTSESLRARGKSVNNQNNSLLNDSNAENIEPIGMMKGNLFANQHPWKNLSHRSPLRNVNVLEVIKLPPLALHSLNKISTPINKKKMIHQLNSPKRVYFNANRSVSTFSDSFGDTSEIGIEKEELRYSCTKLFGFDEILNECDEITDKNEKKENLLNVTTNLKKKLQKLREKLTTNHSDLVTEFKSANSIFTKNSARIHQKNIKQMLCSTMINESKNHAKSRHDFNKTIIEESEVSNITTDFKKTINQEAEVASNNFFNDSSLKKPSNSTLEVRTYVRQQKKKRKRNNFLAYLDSESEDDADDYSPIKKKKHCQKKQNDPAALESFCNEFNSMCEEVESYQMIIE